MIIRAGYGVGDVDLQFRKRAQKCCDRGDLLQIYWLSYAYTTEMAEEEARACVETIEEFPVEFPIYFLFTYDSRRYAESKGVIVTKELILDMANAFCRKAMEMGYEAASLIHVDKYEKDIFKES